VNQENMKNPNIIGQFKYYQLMNIYQSQFNISALSNPFADVFNIGTNIHDLKFDPISIIKEILQDIKNFILFAIFLVGWSTFILASLILTVVCYFFQFIHLPLDFCYALNLSF
jgi:hypothetical protein